jgi:hypothetical protein
MTREEGALVSNKYVRISVATFGVTHVIAAALVSRWWKTLNWADGVSYSRQGILIHRFGSGAEAIEGKPFRFPTTNGILRFNSFLANFLGPGIHLFGASLIAATCVVLSYAFLVRSARRFGTSSLRPFAVGPKRDWFRSLGSLGNRSNGVSEAEPPRMPFWWHWWSVLSPIAVASTSFNLKEAWVFSGCAICAGGIARIGQGIQGERREHFPFSGLGLACIAGGISIVLFFRAYLVPVLLGALIVTGFHYGWLATRSLGFKRVIKVSGLLVGAIMMMLLVRRYGSPMRLVSRSESLGGRQTMGSILGLPAVHPFPTLLRMLIAPWPGQITLTPLGIAQTITATIDATLVLVCGREFYRLRISCRENNSADPLAYFLFAVSFAIWLSYGFANLNAGAIVRQRSLVIPLLGIALARSRQQRIQFWRYPRLANSAAADS